MEPYTPFYLQNQILYLSLPSLPPSSFISPSCKFSPRRNALMLETAWAYGPHHHHHHSFYVLFSPCRGLHGFMLARSSLLQLSRSPVSDVSFQFLQSSLTKSLHVFFGLPRGH